MRRGLGLAEQPVFGHVGPVPREHRLERHGAPQIAVLRLTTPNPPRPTSRTSSKRPMTVPASGRPTNALPASHRLRTSPGVARRVRRAEPGRPPPRDRFFHSRRPRPASIAERRARLSNLGTPGQLPQAQRRWDRTHPVPAAERAPRGRPIGCRRRGRGVHDGLPRPGARLRRRRLACRRTVSSSRSATW